MLYDEWTRVFKDHTTPAAELHGLVSALMTTYLPPKDKNTWRQLFDIFYLGELNDEMLTLIDDTARDIHYLWVDDEGFDYEPMIADDAPLSVRKRDLKHWAAGFISGMGLTDRVSDDALRALLAIASMQLPPAPVPLDDGSDDGDDADEWAQPDGYDESENGNETLDFDEAEHDAEDDESAELDFIELYEHARLAPLHFCQTPVPFERMPILAGMKH